MKDCIFKLGKIDKKIIWPFLFALIQVALNLINNIFPRDKINQILFQYHSGLCWFLLFLFF